MTTDPALAARTAPSADADPVTQRFREALGDAAVDRSQASRAAAETATFATQARVRGILRPRGRDEVQLCVRIAREEGVPLYPTSGGKNWGLGSRVPTADGAYLLDLGAMARILDYDAELAHVTIEPGVTFAQLAAFLRERGDQHFLSTTGSTPASSVVGNTVERGDGVGPLGDRAAHVCALEVVLGTGEVIETGFARFAGASAARAYRWGVGPSLDALFQQSNLGVVTRMTVWLSPRPAALLAFRFALADADALGPATEAIRALRLEGTLRSLVAVWNDFRVLSTRVNLPWDDASPSAALRREGLAALAGGEVAPWYGMGAVYAGSPALAEAARLRITEVLGPHVVDLCFEEQRRGDATIKRYGDAGRDLAAFGSGEAAFAVLSGQPQEASLRTAYFRKATLPPVGDRDLDRDRCGVLWSCPVVPLRAADVTRATAICEAILGEHSFEPMLALLAQHDRTAYLVPILIYDRDVPGDDARARACHDACLAALIAAGYLPYRLGVQSMGALPRPHDDSAALFERLRRAFDPDAVIAPGRYDMSRRGGDDDGHR
ncbi:MAG: FAD-binding oxidoreductase [Nannocystaceae bacterium]